jgi:hypothetical protein
MECRLALAIDSLGLPPPTPARGQDRGGVDHVALDPFGLQHPVNPEAVRPTWMRIIGKSPPVRAVALRLSSSENLIR